MKKHILILLIIFQTLISCGQNTKKNNIENRIDNMVIKNVTVITMNSNEIIKNQDLFIKEGRILSITDAKNIEYKDMDVIDGTGKYMMPSLSDAHVHFPETEEEMVRMMQLYLINGVTKLRSMRGDWKHASWRNKYNTENSIYPKLYLSAPPITRNQELSASQIEELLKTAKDKDFDFVKILSVKDQEIFKKIDFASKKYNLPIGGHFPSNVSDDLIFSSNYTSFEHLGGLAGVTENLETRLQMIKVKNIFLCPTLSWYSVGSGRYSYDELRKQSGMEFVTKSTIDDWIVKTKEYREKIGDNAYKEEVASELKSLEEKYTIIKNAHNLGIPMILSPDSSSKYMVAGFSVLLEMELLKNAQLSNYEILKMATTNFATFFNADYGTIKEGQNADFILLNDNPLENLSTLKNIEGLYYNSNFLDSKKITDMRSALLQSSQN